MSPKIKIVIVDDHPIVIEGIKMMLESENIYQIKGTFNDGQSLLNYLQSNDVDLILLDITLPDTSGIELCLDIKRNHPEYKIIMLSNRSERSIIMQCLQNGASGYMLKNATVNELNECIDEVLSGNIAFCREVKEILNKPSATDLQSIPRLTNREKEILKLLAAGKTSHVIAEELFLSPFTVDTHRKNIMQKFQTKNVAELIRIALENNLIR